MVRELSFYNIARALTIIFDVAIRFVFLGESTTRTVLMTLPVIIIGFILGTSFDSNPSTSVLIAGVTSSCFVALYGIYTKKALRMIPPHQVSFLANLNASLLLSVLVLCFETVPFGAGLLFWGKVMLVGALSYLVNTVTMLQINATSSLTHNVLATAKSGVQTILAVLFWDASYSISTIVRVLVAFTY